MADGRRNDVLVDALVAHFETHRTVIARILESLRLILIDSPDLARHIHSFRWRVKSPDHLREKLHRKAARQGGALDITETTLFERVTDLAGFRILHLHTTQFPAIDQAIRNALDENRYTILEGPEARTWDDEYREYFEGIGVKTVKSERMYTSVHYVVEANTKTKYTAEIQVRTLAEELWGEVDHLINYPNPSPVLACKEEIKVLARITSSCTRLTDSIFRSHDESLKR